MQALHTLHLVFAVALVVLVAWGVLGPRGRGSSDADRAIERMTDRRATARHASPGRRASDS